jgi:anti-sigma regulatory factor (Ser/Thr protein kinase)
MSAASLPRRFSACFASLPELLAVAGAACVAAGMNSQACHRVELVLEEAFSNSIRHGYSGESDKPAWLAATMLPDGLRLVYQDEAPPFNPLQDASLPQGDQVGGVGRVLIKTLPRSATYAREDGRNILTLEFDLRN